ncbi:hypothetical protein TNCV_599961 [Trichonephila clavipes]|nr:hypothetical protein TNCV_599961 [Trichonephila clavipes]
MGLVVRLSLAIALNTMQVTARFDSVSPRLRENTLRLVLEASHLFPNPPTSREDLRLEGYLENPHAAKALHLQASMPSPGIEPRLYDTLVSVTNHYIRWATLSF